MSPVRPRGRRAPALALLPLVLLLAACAAAPTPTPYDASGPCTTDGQSPGVYPELEALLPTALDGAAPTTRDSGRSCTEAALGKLYADGVRELRFAGATWDLGGPKGLTYAVFEAEGLTPEAMIAFYEQGARESGRTDALEVRDVTVEGRPGRRLDTIHRRVAETIVAWPSGTPGRVDVILAAAFGEAELQDALAELAPG